MFQVTYLKHNVSVLISGDTIQVWTRRNVISLMTTCTELEGHSNHNWFVNQFLVSKETKRKFSFKESNSFDKTKFSCFMFHNHDLGSFRIRYSLPIKDFSIRTRLGYLLGISNFFSLRYLKNKNKKRKKTTMELADIHLLRPNQQSSKALKNGFLSKLA